MIRPFVVATLLAATALLVPSESRAAESYDNCVGFIDALPATITTGGTWCLRKDLNINLASGNAINVGGHNITIDCNDFRINGLGAGDATRTNGIYALNRHNVTVRNCQVRGFFWGVSVTGNSSLIEDNRLEGNTFIGIGVKGDGTVIRGNRVLDTGGTNYVWNPRGVGIYTDGDAEILGNLVGGVFATAGSNAMAFGINPLNNLTGSVMENNVKAVLGDELAEAHAISFFGTTGRVSVDSNNLVGTGAAETIGVYCPAENAVVVSGNIANGFHWPMLNCALDAGNVVYPSL